MTGTAKRKGDRAEPEAVSLIRDELGVDVHRMLGAGRVNDTGDIDGLKGWSLQVCDWTDVARALREKPLEADQQARNAGNPFAATLIRSRGGSWRVGMTVPGWATVVREVMR